MKKLILLIILLSMNACAVMDAGPSASDYQQALQLVDTGVGYLRENKLMEAEANFQMAYDLAGLAAAVDGLGCVAMAREEYGRAEKLFWEAYEMDNTYDTSLGNLAMLYQAQGRADKARELYLHALSADPKNYKARNNYAVFLASNSGDKTKILAELMKAEALFNDPKIYGNIKRVKEGK